MNRLILSVMLLFFAGVSSAGDCQRESICLNGIWQATAASTRDAVMPEGAWSNVRVPFCYGQYEDQHFIMPENMNSHTVAVWFRRLLPLPKTWNDGRRIFLHYQAIHEAHSIWLNGQLIQTAPAAKYCTHVEVTSAVQWGKTNELVIQTVQPTHEIEFNRYTRDLGITRDIFLEATPETAVDYVLISPSVKMHQLNVRFGVTNRGAQKYTDTLECEVLDETGKCVLPLPALPVALPAGESKEFSVSVPWQDPVLWGFAHYGKPYLYKMRTRLGKDERFDRFGFREFTTQGSSFYLNGKKIFLKGDLISRYTIFHEHPAAMMVHFQKLAAAGMNFLRLHGFRYDSHCWYQVADEIGFLVEAQARGYRDGSGDHTPDSETVKTNWQSYVRENYNHPSIVFWSVDNESFHFNDVNAEKMHQFDRLVSFVRALDPTRIIELHHGYALYPYAVKGEFTRDNFQTFNIHPYGALRREINGEIRKTGFQLEVPVVVGELFGNPDQRKFVQDPNGTAEDLERVAKKYATQITDASQAEGVASIVLCSLEGDGFIGINEKREVQLGPWGKRALSFGSDGLPQALKREKIRMRWPALSGTGTHADAMLTFQYDGGSIMHDMNWFDPSVPFFSSTNIVTAVRKAFDQIPDGPTPHWEKRHPELLVLLPDQAAGSVVKLTCQATGETQSVASDPNGRAWFRVDTLGTYIAEYSSDGVRRSKDITIVQYPAMGNKPGFDYLSIVEFAPGLTKALQKELTAPMEFMPYDVEYRGEVLRNRDFSMWVTPARCLAWESSKVEKVPGKESEWAIQVRGHHNAAFQDFPALTAGARYRLSGLIRKDAGENCGTLRVLDKKQNTRFQVSGSGEVGKWVEVSGEFEADGTEELLFCCNDHMGETGLCSYDRISLLKIADPKIPEASASQSASAAQLLTPEGGEQGVRLVDGRLLYTVKDDSGKPHLVLDGKLVTTGSMPKVSNNGRFAAFSATSGTSEVKIIDLSTLKIVECPVKIQPDKGAFFWCGVALLWQSSGKTAGYDPDTGKMLDTPPQLPEHTLTISADGGKIAFGQGRDIVIQDASGKVLAQIKPSASATTENERKHSPVFSPDGNKIAYVSETIRPLADIMLLDLTSGKTEALTNDHLDYQDPVFTPDGECVVFSGQKGESTVLYQAKLPITVQAK